MLFRLDRENQSLTTSNSISHVCKSNFGIATKAVIDISITALIATPVNDALTNICIRDLLIDLRNGSHLLKDLSRSGTLFI